MQQFVTLAATWVKPLVNSLSFGEQSSYMHYPWPVPHASHLYFVVLTSKRLREFP